jgi:sulfite exporter TauE/SafE
MDWGIIGSSFIFGIGASLSCLSICIPILVPHIMERDKTLKEGLITSTLLSLGRLMIYLGIGIIVFWVGFTLSENAPSLWLAVTFIALGFIVLIYGAWLVFSPPKPRWCPAKLASNFRPMFSVILGLLIGSIFCPILWAALIAAALTRDLSTMFFSVIAFWLGSSTSIISAGTVSGGFGGRWSKKVGSQRLREIMGMVLMMVGAFYIFLGLT